TASNKIGLLSPDDTTGVGPGPEVGSEITMRIRSKIFTIVGVLGISTIAVCAMGLFALSKSGSTLADTESSYVDLMNGEKIRTLIVDVTLNSRGIWMSADAKQAKPFIDRSENDFAGIDGLITELKKDLDPEELAAMEKFETTFAPFKKERSEIASVAAEQGPA